MKLKGYTKYTWGPLTVTKSRQRRKWNHWKGSQNKHKSSPHKYNCSRYRELKKGFFMKALSISFGGIGGLCPQLYNHLSLSENSPLQTSKKLYHVLMAIFISLATHLFCLISSIPKELFSFLFLLSVNS